MIRKVRIYTLIFVASILVISCRNSASSTADNLSGDAVSLNVPTGLEIGNRAPDLTFQSPDGKQLTLSDLKGKMVLIDFWASWCMPCRVENPNLVNVYKTYKNNKFKGGEGFTIYSVSLDKTKEAWLEAIEKDKLEWENHVSDLKGWEAEPAAIYHIEAIPANFLIDGNGIIVAKNLRAEALGDTIMNLLQ